MTHSLAEIPFGSLLVYQPRPSPETDSDLQRRSLILRDCVKTYHQQSMDRIVAILKEHLGVEGELISLFDRPNVTLVPIPGHAPLSNKDAKWNAKLFCQQLETAGLGKMSSCVLRNQRVNKSSTSSPDNRPTVPVHCESMKLTQDLFLGDNVLLVDDVITRGSTMLAAASIIADHYPNAQIFGFAIIRTMSRGGILDLKAPCVGTIKLGRDGLKAYRTP